MHCPSQARATQRRGIRIDARRLVTLRGEDVQVLLACPGDQVSVPCDRRYDLLRINRLATAKLTKGEFSRADDFGRTQF